MSFTEIKTLTGTDFTEVLIGQTMRYEIKGCWLLYSIPKYFSPGPGNGSWWHTKEHGLLNAEVPLYNYFNVNLVTESSKGEKVSRVLVEHYICCLSLLLTNLFREISVITSLGL